MTAPAINIGMNVKDRENISKGLSRILAESFLLYMKTHNYHWNVKGPMFQTLHVMFEEQYTELWNALDEIAERIRSLGFAAPGTLKEYLKLASIKEIDGVPGAEDMIRDVLAGSEAVSRLSRDVLELADKAGDDPTVDLLTERMQVHEKNAWMLRSLIDTGAGTAAVPARVASRSAKPVAKSAAKGKKK
ncbi:DNA starvation/stationary phase protection protein [Oxalobacter vibrioformis]|uniref:DNA starvation/stationary phase protection protein n=1 Tax=Oxalobacter vibrioformis TaxID=933080 RepID=A0A9E9P2B1_9BURK|nr:Dps family protein [Oxalobacter vibrioformis]WAW09030.1 DNA starvation/stationary phase protection protein [Oxalobacter vibrioformis]